MTPSLKQENTTEAAALLLLASSSNQQPAAALPPKNEQDNPTTIPDDDDDECCRSAKRAATGKMEGFVTAAEALLVGPPPSHQETTAVEDLNASRASVVSLSSRSSTARGGLPFDEFPATEEEARVQLEVVFSLEEWSDMGDQEHVLETLSMFPVLATERFADCTGNSFHPLAHLIFSQTGLEHIREVLNLWPDVLALPQGREQNLPLHIACVYDNYDEVTAFLVRSHPLALTKFNGDGMLPLHRVLAKKQFIPCNEIATFALIQFMVGLYPQSVVLSTASGMTALDYAFHEGYDIFVLYFILNLLAPVMQQFTVGKSYYGKPVVLDLDKAQVLNRIMAHTQNLHCEPMEWTAEGLSFFLDCLKNNPTATNKVRLRLAQSDMDSEGRFSLKQALEMNTNLNSFCLVCPSNDAKLDNSALLQSVREGLKLNRGIQCFQLGQFLGRMLDLVTCSAGDKLTTVEVAQLSFTDVAAEWNPNPDVFRASPLQSLTITSCLMHPDCVRKLISNLALMPALNAVSLDVFGRDFSTKAPEEQSKSGPKSVKQQYNVTTELLALLGNGKLRSLSLGSYPVLDFGPLCEELKQNTTLQFFNVPTCFETDQANEEAMLDVMASHNTSLLQVKTATINEPIIHYTTLNALGRGKLRDPSLAHHTFVDHICSITLINALEGNTKHSVMYGLLRECPKVWASWDGQQISPTSRKRRRNPRLPSLSQS
ncbi:expressed unknown protein [Seminavis robusta]|uniref:Uncharacterized protein n=1 Tax=Seminavis robusta TaxID=568900 RepID=A0A9N8E0Q5_9STRA|nr:expressed unknown protein [Seminavis robusta]|eukprot:Sro392_g133430.1 n/a (713) ;mRNA; r:44639-46777